MFLLPLSFTLGLGHCMPTNDQRSQIDHRVLLQVVERALTFVTGPDRSKSDLCTNGQGVKCCELTLADRVSQALTDAVTDPSLLTGDFASGLNFDYRLYFLEHPKRSSERHLRVEIWCQVKVSGHGLTPNKHKFPNSVTMKCNEPYHATSYLAFTPATQQYDEAEASCERMWPEEMDKIYLRPAASNPLVYHASQVETVKIDSKLISSSHHVCSDLSYI